MTIEISLFQHADWPEIIHEVIAARTSAYLDWNGPKTVEQQEAEAKAWLDRYAPRRDVTLFAARQDGKLIGYLIADERERGEYHISHTGVHSESKRQGVGRALIQRFVEEARHRGYRAATTTTYNRYPGMLLLLIQEGFYIQGMSWVERAKDPRISLRKELKT